MYQIYRKDELIKLIKKTERHLIETQNDIMGYYSELRCAQKSDNIQHALDCLYWIKLLCNTHRHLIDEYNDYQNKLSYTFY